jgi:uncharacterized membrane protein YdjX (TVP38/TMEM64 family)
MLINNYQVMINPLLHRSLKVLLWICIFGAVAGVVVQILGSDIGAVMVFIFCAVGSFPAFHFASLVAFKDAGADEKSSDNPSADSSQPPRGDRN